MNSFKIYIFFLSILVAQVSFAVIPDTIEVYMTQTQLNIGAPFIIDLTFKFNQSNLSKKTGEVSPVLERQGLALQISSEDTKDPVLVHGLFPRKFALNKLDGRKYTERAVILYDWSSQKVIFDKPGIYKIAVLDAKKRSSNQIEIAVKSSCVDEQALSVLVDPNDFAFLMHGLHKNQISKDRLEQIALQYENTLLAKWSMARLGVEIVKELQRKYPNGEDFKVNYNKGLISEPLVTESYSYLLAATEIPDGLSLKEEVLYYLISLELLKGDYRKAESYANELGEKYSKKKHGKKALKIKSQILKFESKQAK